MLMLKTKRWDEVRVIFHHLPPERGFPPGTTCWIKNDSSEIPIGEGRSKLIAPDQYCKARGRKIALRRALENLGATRDERTQFWEAYFEAMKPKETK